MAENTADKGHSVLMKLLSAFSYNDCKPYKAFVKIFDSKIASILLYGPNIWGLTYMQCTESVHVVACKRFLNVPKYACNNSVLGDLARFPLYLYSCKRCIKYWIRITRMPNNRLVKKCYVMMKLYDNNGHTNWATIVRKRLYENG